MSSGIFRPLGVHVGQDRRAGLGHAGLLVVHQIRKLLPALGVRRRIVDQPRDVVVHPGRRQLHGGGLDVEGVLRVGKNDRQQVREIRDAPAAVGEREAAAEQQQAAAAPIDELPNQLPLGRREIGRFDRTDDERLIGEQVLRARRKTLRQFLRVLDALAVDLVFGGAQHRDQLHDAVVVFGAPDELVLPARLAFDVEHAALVRFDVDQAGDGVVGDDSLRRAAPRSRTGAPWLRPRRR